MKDKSDIILVHGTATKAILSGIYKGSYASKKALSYKESLKVEDFYGRRDFVDLPKWLIEDGFRVFFASYDSNEERAPNPEDCVEDIRRQILSVVKKSKTRKVIIIAKSSGGMVIRAYIDGPLYKKDRDRLGYDFVEKVFLVGVPNKGVHFYWLMKLGRDYDLRPNDGMHKDMSSKDYIKKFNKRYVHKSDVPYYLIGGCKCNGFSGKMFAAYCYMKYGPNDGMCSLKNTTDLKGKKDSLVVKEAHELDFGDCYFGNKKGKMSETYLRGIRPILVEERDYYEEKGVVEKGKDLLLYLPLSLVAVSVSFVFCFIIFVIRRMYYYGRRIFFR